MGDCALRLWVCMGSVVLVLLCWHVVCCCGVWCVLSVWLWGFGSGRGSRVPGLAWPWLECAAAAWRRPSLGRPAR